MTIGDREVIGNKIPYAFANHFRDKVDEIVRGTQIDKDVYNGRRLFHCSNVHFMNRENVASIIRDLKIKNCEGYDRIPLRIFKEGAEYLIDTLADLCNKIYKERKIPQQWKVAKIIPLHKRGDIHKIENYRPISNLCTMSKIFEKLILRRIWEISKIEGIDLTGETQHGFKPGRSTITAAMSLQSIISRSLDENKYVAVASLDLSAAFDVVDRTLLHYRMEVMGLPEDVRDLIKDWLTDRQSYVDVNGEMTYMEDSGNGTVQGSVLGPILFSIFIRPVYEIKEMTTYADDNYVTRDGMNLKVVLEEERLAVVKVSDWLKKSGLKVNEQKTELCIFHKHEKIVTTMDLKGVTIESKESINILGIRFDKNLKWDIHVENTIRESNKILHALRSIKQYFTFDERKDLLTSLYFSKFYYGCEVWHLPDLAKPIQKSIKRSSANALKLCIKTYDQFTTHTDIQ